MTPLTTRILETALYCDDLDRSAKFYRELFELPVLFADPRLVSLDAGGGTVLLLFKRGASSEGMRSGSTYIPPHDGKGPAHLAFSVTGQVLETLRARLAERGVAVESEVEWARGGRSLYFRDPDRHSVELATPGVWATY
jgi:catechol 2,3-dioxygenase-like lactoylglutathione lyase family enzyme